MMRRNELGKMVVIWCSLLLLLLEMLLFPVEVHSQYSTEGFISIDCGIAGNSNYTDAITGIPYTSDEQYIDTGKSFTISTPYLTSSLEKQLSTVRSFPNGLRNCYTLKPLQYQKKYLLRATFMYGNYDGLQSATSTTPLLFDLYIDVNFWKKVNISNAAKAYRIEAIVVSLAEYISVCLINTGTGTPFMSVLELRPLQNNIYTYVNTSQYFVLAFRDNAGPTTLDLIRYPDDRYDRIWYPWSQVPHWTEISTTLTVNNYPIDQIEAPSAVMQTAATPVKSSTMFFYWDSVDSGVPNNQFYANLLFSEIVPGVVRHFNVYINDGILGNVGFNYTPPYLMSDIIYSTRPLVPSQSYQWALNSTGLSVYPPLLNGLEVYSPMLLNESLTDSGDVGAITNIKVEYQVTKNWVGDPCGPREYIWEGLNCTYDNSSNSYIVSVNLSSSGLNGTISPSFAMLTEIEYLDLFNNNLTGTIPIALGDLQSLKVLNLSCNSLIGPFPDSLLTRSEQGLLQFGFDNDSHPCPLKISTGPSLLSKSSSKKTSTPIIVAASIIPVVLLLVMGFTLWIIRKRRGPDSNASLPPWSPIYDNKEHFDPRVQLEIQQFMYAQLTHMTRNFVKAIGKGGFGTVYHGYLDNGEQVAIKLRSEASQQGTKEFSAEIQNLKRIHHRNLVSLVGYCSDGPYQALVYEYMPQGSLKEHLGGVAGDPRLMRWRERLRIAVEAAQGLEYLHKGCNPSIIHRDIKTSNILLNNELEAKISDFGLSRAFQSDYESHISTTLVVGTPGYVDPEYQYNLQLNEKSDVYSFGVVLLELITGKPAIIPGPEKVHIVQWVSPNLVRGDIDEIVDKRLPQGEYDVNSVWKVVDLAVKCTNRTGSLRPTMTDVLIRLKESMELVIAASEILSQELVSSEDFDRSETSAFEIGVSMPRQFGPSVR